MINEVFSFNRENLGIGRRPIDLLSQKEWEWLKAALHEEIKEIEEAFAEQDIAKVIDGLIDLCYFGVGGLYRVGLNEDQATLCFLAVHKANCTKKPGVKVNSSRPNDGSIIDGVKPDDFVDPVHHIREILFGGQ